MATKPRITPAARAFMEDEYQENVWSNGDERIESLDDIAHYWEQWKSDCKTWGVRVPRSLTPEIYFQVWNEIYTRRTGVIV